VDSERCGQCLPIIRRRREMPAWKETELIGLAWVRWWSACTRRFDVFTNLFAFCVSSYTNYVVNYWSVVFGFPLAIRESSRARNNCEISSNCGHESLSFSLFLYSHAILSLTNFHLRASNIVLKAFRTIQSFS